MKEILLIAGVMGLGYFTESSIDFALSESCRIYEDSTEKGIWKQGPFRLNAKRTKPTTAANLQCEISSQIALSPTTSGVNSTYYNHAQLADRSIGKQ